MSYDWGTKEWFEHNFSDIEDESVGDRWGHRWRASQKFRFDNYVNILVNILPAKRKIRILDIGCALGDFTKSVWKLDKKNKIIGIDISENAIKQVVKNDEFKYNPNVEFSTGCLPLLPFKEKSFNLILCLEVLYYLNLEDRRKSMSEMNRLLQKNGFIIISGVLNQDEKYFKEKDILHLISEFFVIEVVKYNHGLIYSNIEKYFLMLLDILEITRGLLKKNNKEFYHECGKMSRDLQAMFAKVVRLMYYKLPSGKRLGKITYILLRRVIMNLLSWEVAVSVSNKLTTVLLGNKGNTNIIILARKINEGF